MAEATPVSDKTYETLNDRQQAHIDELARDRVDSLDRTAKEIVESAAGGESFEPYNPHYISEFRQTHADIIDERADTLLNGHATVERGNVSVDGEIDLTDLPREQGITDRPVKETQNQDPEPRVSVEMSLDTARRVLASMDVPEEHRQAVFEAVVEL